MNLSDYTYSGAEVLHHGSVATTRGRGKTPNFTQAQVDAVCEVLRGLLSDSKSRQKDFAKLFNVSQQTISRVKNGKGVTGIGYLTASQIVRYAGLGTLDDFFRARGVYEYQHTIRDAQGKILRTITDDDLDPQTDVSRAMVFAKQHAKMPDSLIHATIAAHGGPTAALTYLTWVRHFLNAQAALHEFERRQAAESAPPSSKAEIVKSEPKSAAVRPKRAKASGDPT